MDMTVLADQSRFIYENLRMKTFPVGVKFLKDAKDLPEKARRPQPRLIVPGPGDRIFSMTGDDEMIFAMPYAYVEGFILGLKESGKKAGTRYPITYYQNFQPEFPPHYQALAKKLGI